MKPWATRALVLASVVLGGLTSGLNRAIIDTPAWRYLGVDAWASFSRQADLGPGVAAYSLENIPHALLALAAAGSFWITGRTPRAAGPPIYLSALGMLGVMATTVVAAPIMFSVAHLDDNQAALHDAFDRFTFWGVYVRGGFTILAFLTSVWALAVLAHHPGPHTGQHSAAEAPRAEHPPSPNTPTRGPRAPSAGTAQL